MLVLHNPKTSSRSSHSSLVSPSHQNHKSIALQPSRSQHQCIPSQRMISRTTDDIFSNMRSHQMHIFNQVENFQRQMMKHMDNMFSFGGFGDFGSMRSPISSGTQSTRNQGPQRMISKTYVYQTKKDASGNMYHEKYFSHNYAMKGSDGTTIVERQEGYHNSGNNLQRIAEERRINAKAKKMTQERIKGQDYLAKNIQYHNMGEEEINHFDNAWDSHTKQLGFYRDYGNMLGHISGGSSRRNEDEYIPSQRAQRRPASSHHRTQPSSSGQTKPKRSNPQTLALTNDNNNNQNHARVRRSDIQPTIPARRGGIEVQIPEQRYEPAHEPIRPVPVRQQQEPRVHHRNENQERPVTRQVERRQTGSVRNDGNFKNKVVTNAMPLAG